MEQATSSYLVQYPPTDRWNEENLTSLPTPPDVGNFNRTIPNTSSGFALGKIVDTMKNVLTCPSAEQTMEQEETALSPLQSSSPRPQKKVEQEHYIERPVEKRKKRCIPFVALALLLAFTSLCIISLVRVFVYTGAAYNTM